MKESAITKTLKKSIDLSKEYSVGFSRLQALPVRVRKSLNLASLLRGADLNKAHSEQKSFLESLTEDEFKTWMAAA